MHVIKTGATRTVIIIGNYAIKIPKCYSYRSFLNGLLANEQETLWYKAFKWTKKLCPVLFCCWGCFFIVMPRARVLTDDEAREWPYSMKEFVKIEPEEESVFPCEMKSDSFGWLNGQLVIIDYGS